MKVVKSTTQVQSIYYFSQVVSHHDALQHPLDPRVQEEVVGEDGWTVLPPRDGLTVGIIFQQDTPKTVCVD